MHRITCEHTIVVVWYSHLLELVGKVKQPLADEHIDCGQQDSRQGRRPGESEGPRWALQSSPKARQPLCARWCLHAKLLHYNTEDYIYIYILTAGDERKIQQRIAR